MPPFKVPVVSKLALTHGFLWLPYVIEQAIIFSSCGYFFLLIFSLPILSRWKLDVLPYFHTWLGLSANLECRSEMCCTRLAENTGRKKSPKICQLGTITTLSGCIFAIKAYIDNQKKNLLNSNISSTRLHNMVNFGPLAAEISLPVWGTPANFNGFHMLASLLHWRHSTDVNQTLHDVWPSPGRL